MNAEGLNVKLQYLHSRCGVETRCSETETRLYIASQKYMTLKNLFRIRNITFKCQDPEPDRKNLLIS